MPISLPPTPPAVRAPAPCPPPPAAPAALAALVTAERAFAQLSADSGAQAAFMANLADDAVLFRPAPVPGRAFQREHPIPKEGGALWWTPMWGAVSAAGDLGFTGGPFAVIRIKGADSTVVGRGTFNSVWRREAGGRWRLLMDVGAGGATPDGAPAVGVCATVTPVPVAAAPAARPAAPATLAAVLAADSLAGRGGALPTGATTRVVRDGTPVRPGAPYPAAGRMRGTPIAGGVAASGDLAYSYGSYTLTPAAPGGAAERGHYLRVWSATPRGWTVVLDVTNPLPEKR